MFEMIFFALSFLILYIIYITFLKDYFQTNDAEKNSAQLENLE